MLQYKVFVGVSWFTMVHSNQSCKNLDPVNQGLVRAMTALLRRLRQCRLLKAAQLLMGVSAAGWATPAPGMEHCPLMVLDSRKDGPK